MDIDNIDTKIVSIYQLNNKLHIHIQENIILD